MAKRQQNGPPADDDDLINLVLSGSTNIHNLGGINDIFNVRGTEHDANAIDFEDIDELADDEDEIALQQAQKLQQQDHSRAEASRSADAAMEAANKVVGTLDSATEEALQEEADAEFDGMFGDDEHGMDNNLLGLQNAVPEDEGLDFGGVFEDDTEIRSENDSLGVKNGSSDLLKLVNSIPELSPEEKKRRETERAIKKAKLQRIVAKLERKRDQRNLAKYFPGYSADKPYNNHLLFLLPPRYYGYHRPQISQRQQIKPLLPTKVNLEPAKDQKKLFKSKKPAANDELPPNISSETSGRVVSITPGDFEALKVLQQNHESAFKHNFKTISFLSSDILNDMFQNVPKDLVFSTTSWDDDAIINADEPPKPPPVSFQEDDLENNNNDNDNDDDDLLDDIYNGNVVQPLTLDMNDPKLLLVPGKQDISSKKSLLPSKPLLRFDVLNDKDYEILKKNYNTKVRQQVSNLNIDHSVPAARLQLPYYKVKLSKQECRSFHRPKFLVRPGATITFHKLKVRKKKKDRGKTALEIFAKTGDLTITDSAAILGMEYAEQYPLILLNFGMASKIINYYRKEREDDTTRPKAPFGETHVLGVEDKLPFWNFGHVERGDFVPTLYNNMVRAPIFKHDMKQTDFLLVRSQGAGLHTRHYLRPLNNVYAVGQLFPAVEVPAPHLRKITNTLKNRLKIIVYRTMNKTGEAHISVKDILHHFPDQNDMQNRQRLKEFMEYQRKGEGQGFWKMKFLDHVPTEEEIRQMITPEDLCLLDSMQLCQQTLDDYIAIMTEDKSQEDRERLEKEERERRDLEKKTQDTAGGPTKRERRNREILQEDIEEELCSWNTSRNFLSANQTKATLQLNGDGDPSGIGIGFLLLRATQKSTFSPLFGKEPDGPRTAAQLQKIYDDEISRIWYAQRRLLTVEKHTSHDLRSVYKEYKPKKLPPVTEFEPLKGQVLKIVRRIRDENGIVQRRVSTIRDPSVIRAYTKRKQQIEDEMLRNAEVDDIIPTNDKELNKLRRKALEEKLASLEKRAKIGRGRRNAAAAAAAGNSGQSKESVDIGSPAEMILAGADDVNGIKLPNGLIAISGKGIGKGKSTARKCTACGELGHIRTRKTCPLFNQQNLQNADFKESKNDGDGMSLMPPIL